MRLLGIFFGVLLTVVGTGASWADGSIKDGPAPAEVGCVGQFSGAYLGGQVGYVSHDMRAKNELLGGHGDGDDSGVIYGVYGGYNVQCGRLLVGFESDFNGADTDAKFTDSCCDAYWSSEMNFNGSSRLRLGIVHNDSLLFYVTGGVAYANLDRTLHVGSLDFHQKDGDTEFGYTVGGGIEFIRMSKWSFKAEALYTDFNTDSIDYEDTGCGISCTARFGWDDNYWTARIGIAYHFGAREEVAAPLK